MPTFDKNALPQHYADLYDEQHDPALTHLIETLNLDYASAEPPAHLSTSLEQTLQEHIEERGNRLLVFPRRVAQAKRPSWFPRRVGLVAAIVLCLLAVTVTSYASTTFGPILNNILSMEKGTQSLLKDRQYTDFHQTKTAGNCTISLNKAYADANRVVIGFVVQKGSDCSDTSSFPMLTTQQGVKLPGEYGLGDGDANGPAANSFSFNADRIQGSPKELHLHLEFPSRVHNAITFDFSVPFHSGRVANLHQSITADGRTVTLDRVVVTPSETRVYIRGVLYSEDTLFQDQMTVEKQSYQVDSGSYVPHETPFINFHQSLFEKHGEWTFELLKRHHPDGKLDPTPFVFHFIMP